jgi:hypothetical protein
MSFKDALINLGNLTVAGIAHNYGIDALPESLSRSQLPALLVMPIDTQGDKLFRERGFAFEGIAFGSGTKTVRFVLSHLLLLAPVEKGKGMREHLSLLADCIDSYMLALAADITLSNSIEEAAEVGFEPGVYRLGQSQYYGCAFRHTWVIGVQDVD